VNSKYNTTVLYDSNLQGLSMLNLKAFQAWLLEVYR